VKIRAALRVFRGAVLLVWGAPGGSSLLLAGTLTGTLDLGNGPLVSTSAHGAPTLFIG